MSDLAVHRRSSAPAYGSRADVPFGCGNVVAQTVFAGFDRNSGRASYALRIANNSEHSLRTVIRFPASPLASTSELHVAPFSILDTLVPSKSTRHDDRAIVEVCGSNLRFTLDANAVTQRKSHVRSWIAATGVCTGLALIAAALFHPHGVVGHSPQIAPRPVIHTRVVVRHVVDKPLVDDLEVTPSAILAGSLLHVRYGARGNGNIWLLDEDGRVWAKHAITATGETHFTVPQSAAGRSLRVVLSARRGAQHAQMAATVAVLPDGSNVFSANQGAAVPPGPTVTPDQPKAGDPVYIHFPSSHGEALVSITDASGSIVEETDVAPSEREAVLRAPAAAAPATYDVVVSITDGNRQEQTVHALTVLP